MENPLRGIALALGSTLLFSLSDATAKFLTGSLPVVEIAWIRYLIFVGFALTLAVGSGPGRFGVRRPGLQVIRGLGLVASSLAFIFALHYLPLADASAIGFVSPLLTAMLAVPMLGEVVGVRRWVAAIIGLVGVIVVVRPGTGAFHPAAILVLLSSLSWAVASVLTRMVAGVDSSATTLLWSAGTGALLLSAALPFDFLLPTAGEFLLLLVLGVGAGAVQLQPTDLGDRAGIFGIRLHPRWLDVRRCGYHRAERDLFGALGTGGAAAGVAPVTTDQTPRNFGGRFCKNASFPSA